MLIGRRFANLPHKAALGAMTFGDDWGWGAAKDESQKLYDAFREAGGNFIDTANIYTYGASESFLGEFMQGHRQKSDLRRTHHHMKSAMIENLAPGATPSGLL